MKAEELALDVKNITVRCWFGGPNWSLEPLPPAKLGRSIGPCMKCQAFKVRYLHSEERCTVNEMIKKQRFKIGYYQSTMGSFGNIFAK